MSIYDFTVKTIQGKEKSLADYKGKVLLIVNTASKCGFTPQFDDLQKLYLPTRTRALRSSASRATSSPHRIRAATKKSSSSAATTTA